MAGRRQCNSGNVTELALRDTACSPDGSSHMLLIFVFSWNSVVVRRTWSVGEKRRMEERRMEEVYGKVVLARGISSRDLAYNVAILPDEVLCWEWENREKHDSVL